jgi:hypothetical protein
MSNVVPSTPILVTLIMGQNAPTKHRFLQERHGPPKRRFLQERHGVVSEKTGFFIVTDVKTSNLTYFDFLHLKIKLIELPPGKCYVHRARYPLLSTNRV